MHRLCASPPKREAGAVVAAHRRCALADQASLLWAIRPIPVFPDPPPPFAGCAWATPHLVPSPSGDPHRPGRFANRPYKTAMGLTGEPVPPMTLRGLTVSMNSQRPSWAHASDSG